MTRIQFSNDVTGAQEEMQGSDGRGNTSSRSDSRGYYNSRDKGRSFALTFSHPLSANGEYSFYWKNTSTTDHFVVSGVGINSDLGARMKLHFVTGTAGDGVSVTPVNMNKTSPNDAEAICLHDGAGTTISGLTSAGEIDFVLAPLQGHEELRLDDRVRLGQNDAIALEVDEVVSGGRMAKISRSGEIAVAPLEYSEPVFRELDLVNTAYSFFSPKRGRQLVISGFSFKADRGVSTGTDAIVILYEASTVDTLVVDKTIFQDAMVRGERTGFTNTNLIVREGKWVNAKTTDDDIHVTVYGYYVGAL